MENSPISGGRNGTDRVPQSPPRRNAGLKAGNLSLMREGMKNDQMSTGKNTSFICSHVDSLTGLIRPISGFCPDQS